MKRTLGPLVIALWAFTFARSALAQEEVTACITAHHDAQKNRSEHRLVEAEKQLLACGDLRCPQLIGVDCRKWAGEVHALIPSVVLDVRGEDGSPLARARVRIDGAAWQDLDGRAVVIDPGEHLFHFEAPEKTAFDLRAVVLEGQRAQKFSAVLRGVLRENPPAQIPPPRRGIPAATVVLGATGVVGLGLATVFGISGLGRRSDLDDANCKPSCDPGAVDRVRRDFVVADISLGVGVVSLAIAVVIWGTQSTAPSLAANSPLQFRF